MENKLKITTERLINAINESTCAFTAAMSAMERLKGAGFTELTLEECWDIKKGGKYYINVHDSSVFAFSIGKDFHNGMLRVAAAHTDHPCLYIKPSPEMIAKGYGKLNLLIGCCSQCYYADFRKACCFCYLKAP